MNKNNFIIYSRTCEDHINMIVLIVSGFVAFLMSVSPVSSNSIFEFYCISLMQTFYFIIFFSFFKYRYRIVSVRISDKGFKVDYGSGFTDYFRWERLRSVDTIFFYIVFSENSYFFMNSFFMNQNNMDKINKLSHGKSKLLERKKLLGSKKLLRALLYIPHKFVDN